MRKGLVFLVQKGSKNTIDAEEIADSIFPAVLTQRVAAHLEKIEEVQFQFRGGASWMIGKWRYRPGPTEGRTVDDICKRVCEAICKDAEKSGNIDYRVRLATRDAPDHGLEYRHVYVHVRSDADGKLQVNDKIDSESDGRLEYLAQAADAAIKSLNAVATAATGYANIGSALERVMVSVAEVINKFSQREAQDVELQIRLTELQQRGAALAYTHSERMDRNERISDFLDKLADPLADAIEEEVADYIRRKKEERGEGHEAKEPKDPKESRIARDMRRFIDSMSKEEREKFYALFIDDELRLLVEITKAATDEEVVAIFMKLGDMLGKKYENNGGTKKFQQDVVDAVGLAHAMRLRKIIKTIRKKAGHDD